jgi:hypothetical protein
MEWFVGFDQFELVWELVSDALLSIWRQLLTAASPFLKGISNLTEFDDSLKDYVSGSYVSTKYVLTMNRKKKRRKTY